MATLFAEKLEVVNVGLPAFAEAIRAAGGTAIAGRVAAARRGRRRRWRERSPA